MPKVIVVTVEVPAFSPTRGPTPVIDGLYQSIDIRGEATRSIDFGLGNMWDEYHIYVELANLSARLMQVESIDAYFLTIGGESLHIQSSLLQEEARTIVRGKVLETDFGTDGYTMDLIRSAKDMPLQLHVYVNVLFLERTYELGPYVTNLPDLYNMPESPPFADPEEVNGLRLIFLRP